MPLYCYKTLSLQGTINKAIDFASSKKDLIDILKIQNLILLKCHSFQKYSWHRLSCLNKALFCDHMAQCLSASLSMEKAIQSYRLPWKILAPLKQVILTHIAHGYSLSEGVEAVGIFDEFGINMIRILEKCDKIQPCFEILAKTYYQQHRFKQKLKKLLTYPTLLSLFVLGIFLSFLPTFIKYVQEFLLASQPSYNLSSSFFVHFIDYTFWIYCGLIALTIKGIISLLSQYPSFTYYKEKLSFYYPVVGSLKKHQHLQQFLQLMMHQLKTGLPLMHALHMQANSCKSLVMRKKIEAVARDIAQGLSFSKAVENHLSPSAFITTLLKQGEATGEIEQVIEHSTVLLETELSNRMEQMHQYIQPFFLVAIGLFLMWGVSATLYPLYESLGSGLK